MADDRTALLGTAPPSGSVAVPRRRPAGLVLGGLVALTLLVAVVFMTWDLQGSLDYALRLRATKLAAMTMMGVGLGVATVIFHTITANRILTPALMGFDRLYVLIQSTAAWLLGTFAFLGLDPRLRFALQGLALVGFAIVLNHLFLRRTSQDLHLLLLMGILCGAVFGSLSALVARMLDPNEYTTLADSFYADFATVDTELLGVAAAVEVVALLLAWRLVDRLDVMALGRDLATELGVDHRRTSTQVMILVAVLVAVPTALVGPVTFLGLLVANLAYEVVGTFRHRVTIPAAALLGISTLVGAQLLIEELLGFATRASIVISFVGGVLFLLLVLREAGRPS